MASAKPATAPDSSAAGFGRDRVRGARGADGDDHLTDAETQAERRAHVVPGSGGQRRAARSPGHDLGRGGDPRQPGRLAQRGLGQLRQPAAGGGGEVAGARGVAAVGGGRMGPVAQPPGQPVVRQHHVRGPGGGVRFVLGQPAQLGDRERGRRDAPGQPRPVPGAAHLVDQRRRLRRRAHVVPEQGRPDHLAGLVDDDHAVLLRRHPDGVGAVEQPVSRLGQRPPPQFRVALGAVRVRGGGLPDDGAVVGLAEQHLGGLSGRIDTSDKHLRLPAQGGNDPR